MKNFIKLLFVVLSFTVLADMAAAENWVYSKLGDIYFDTDSIRRSGDISYITGRADGRDIGYGIDCKRDAWLNGSEVISLENKDQYPRPQAASIMACKKWYEIWK